MRNRTVGTQFSMCGNALGHLRSAICHQRPGLCHGFRASAAAFLGGLLLGIHVAVAAAMDGADPPPPIEASGGATNVAPVAITRNDPTNYLRLDFRGVSLSVVLDYLSEAGGFVINNEAEVGGTVDVWSSRPVAKDDAVELLNSVLKRRGSTVIRSGRILTITSLDRSKTADLEVVTGSDAEAVEKSDTVVTQIIPVRYANASQLVNNLQLLLPATTTLSLNESANALILVAPRTDIRRMLKIISPLDTAAARLFSVKVFPLRYADAKELATAVQQLFSPSSTSQSGSGRSSVVQFPGPPDMGGFGPPGMDGPPGSPASSASATGTTTSPKLVATADERSNSLIVTAPEDLLATVTTLVERLDRQVAEPTEVRVFRLRNADPSELADQLAQLFPEDGSSSSGQTQAAFNFEGPPMPGGGPFETPASTTQSSTGERKTKQSRVLAVADSRTASLLVSTGSTLMAKIADLIAQLDANAGRKETIGVWDLHNARPQDVKPILQALFNRRISVQNNTSTSSQPDPLAERETQQENGTTTGSLNLQGSGAGRAQSSTPGF